MSSQKLAPSELWLTQASSDLAVLIRLLDAARDDAAQTRLRCQAIAKAQQVAERAVKGIYNLLLTQREVQDVAKEVWKDHSPKPIFHGLFFAPPRAARELLDQARAMLSHASIDYDWIVSLCALAPAGVLDQRNTEYPYLLSDGTTWTAPAAETSFEDWEVKRYYKLAEAVLSVLSKLVDAAALPWRRPR